MQHQHQRRQPATGGPGRHQLLQQPIQRRLPLQAERRAGCPAAGGRNSKWNVSRTAADHQEVFELPICCFQLVKGFKYMVDLELSRTVCPKGAAVNLTSCDFQPAGRLHQVSSSRGRHLAE